MLWYRLSVALEYRFVWRKITAGVTKCRCREGWDNSFRQLRLLVQLGLLGCVEIRGSWA